MKLIPETKADIVKIIAAKFRTFGGDQPHNGNPIAAALSKMPLQFAAGVDVEEVVNEVLRLNEEININSK